MAKVDEKAIEKLVEQVLEERVVKTLPYTLANTYPKIKGDLALKGTGAKTSQPDGVRKIAKLVPDDKVLDADDIKAAYKLPGATDNEKHMKATIDKLIKGPSSISQAIQDILFPLDKDAIKKAMDDDLGLRGEIGKSTPKPAPAGSPEAETPDAIDRQFDQVYGHHNDAADPIPGVDLDYFSVSGRDPGGRISANFKNRMKESTAEIFKAEIARHGTLVDMFEHYQEISKAINSASNEAEQAKAINNYMTQKSYTAADIYNSLQVMSELESITNDLHGVASGYGFEKLIALMSAGVVFGGDNKAADNLAQALADQNAEITLLSSKSAQGSVSSQKQSKNTIKDLDIGKTMYYLAFQRGAGTGEVSGKSSVVKIFGIGIRRVDGAGGRPFRREDFRYVDLEGEVQKSITFGQNQTFTNKVAQSGSDVVMPVQKFPLFIEIPVLKLDRTITSLASTALQQVNDAALKQIELIQRNIAVLRDKTQVFVALQKRKKKDMSLDASAAAGDAFKALKSSLEGEGYVMDTRTKSDFSDTKSQVSESKFEELDKLILEVLKNNS